MSGKLSNQINRQLIGRYASRRGFALTWLHRLYYLFGIYSRYRRIDWATVERLVFVCKGNICRSAYAELVARSLGVESVSCGVDTTDGIPANNNAVRIAAKNGVDLSGHKTTKMQSLMPNKNDLFIVMEPWQAAQIKQEFGDKCRCTLLGLWGTVVTPHIHDPYGKPDTYFINCFRYIEASVHEIARKIE